MSFSVKFENGLIPVHKLRQGDVVQYCGDLFHIKHVWKSVDGTIMLSLEDSVGPLTEVAALHVEWLNRNDL